MDYNKLTKEELIKICNDKKINYSSSWNKSKLIEGITLNEKKIRDEEEENKDKLNLRKNERKVITKNINRNDNHIWLEKGIITKVFLILSLISSGFLTLFIFILMFSEIWLIFTFSILATFFTLLLISTLEIWKRIDNVRYLMEKDRDQDE